MSQYLNASLGPATDQFWTQLVHFQQKAFSRPLIYYSSLFSLLRIPPFHFVFFIVASTSSQEEVSDLLDNEIQEITSEKSEEFIELKKELETAKKKINSLNDQNSIFRDRITAQAKELM